jgi:hypothetical protein
MEWRLASVLKRFSELDLSGDYGRQFGANCMGKSGSFFTGVVDYCRKRMDVFNTFAIIYTIPRG